MTKDISEIHKRKFIYGNYPLLEFLIDEELTLKKNKNIMVLGNINKSQKKLIKSFGYNITIHRTLNSIIKFSKLSIHSKYDVVLCNNIIQFQRNTGKFLDKIYDALKKDGHLILTGPKNKAEIFEEANLFIPTLTLLIQNLIYSGFDLKFSKIISLIKENSIITKKAKNFKIIERDETGYKWKKKHHDRSPVKKMISGMHISEEPIQFVNCNFWTVGPSFGNNNVAIKPVFPKNYSFKNLKIDFYVPEHLDYFEHDFKNAEKVSQITV